MTDEDAGSAAQELSSEVRDQVAALDRELGEIDMLVGQARAEAARHEQKRAAATEKLGTPGPSTPTDDLIEGYGTLVTMTKRAVLMEAQVDVLEGKRKALARHRDALEALADRLDGVEVPAPGRGPAALAAAAAAAEDAIPPTLSRVVLSAQEDLRREIARSMHDGPAQSLTNIVLQSQIVDRLLERDPTSARGELKLLVQMVQQTLDATKNFIFDVRPMVLDDLGLVPTLRRATRERGRRAHVPVEFESLGADRRLPVDIESTVFRILDEAMAAYLSAAPERVVLRLDWGDELSAHLSAHRTPAPVPGDPLPEVPTGPKVPDAIKQMIQDRHDARDAAIQAAQVAAVVALSPGARRDVLERADSIGARVAIEGGGGELNLTVALPAEVDASASS
jgi:two-component system sensor histidine kinase DegS